MRKDRTTTAPPVNATGGPGTGVADFDADRYLPDMADFDLTEAQKIELLRTLWSIMGSMVELGMSPKICEQIFGADDLPGDASFADGMMASSNNMEKPLDGGKAGSE